MVLVLALARVLVLPRAPSLGPICRRGLDSTDTVSKSKFNIEPTLSVECLAYTAAICRILNEDIS